MSRRRPPSREKPSRGRSAPAPARRAPRGGVPQWLRVVGALVLLGAAAWGWRTWGARAGAETNHPSAAMPPEQARAMGVRALAAKQPIESLPWLERGVEGSGAGDWSAWFDLAKGYASAAMMTTSRAGIEQPLVRSSVERVAMAGACARTFQRAAELAPPGRDRAAALVAWAEFEFAWGRMFEAFALFRRAQSETPDDAALAQRADSFQFMLEHPERFETTEETMRREAAH